MTTARICAWCRRPLLEQTHPAARFCGKKCRQTAWRLRQQLATERGPSEGALHFSYADPPYVGLSRKYYGDESTFAGEVDHPALIRRLEQQRTDGALAGWALSCSVKSLRFLLPLCPDETRTCAWVKPHGAAPATRGPHNCWEALLVVPGRRRQPGVPDYLSAYPARGGGELMGRKPVAFCAWLFDLLGMLPGDSLDDLFPGTGVVGDAWREAGREVSFGADADVSLAPGEDGTVAGRRRGHVTRAVSDTSRAPGSDLTNCREVGPNSDRA